MFTTPYSQDIFCKRSRSGCHSFPAERLGSVSGFSEPCTFLSSQPILFYALYSVCTVWWYSVYTLYSKQHIFTKFSVQCSVKPAIVSGHPVSPSLPLLLNFSLKTHVSPSCTQYTVLFTKNTVHCPLYFERIMMCTVKYVYTVQCTEEGWLDT